MILYRGSLLPDPRYDAVRAVFLAVMDDVEECPDGLYTARLLLFDDTGTAAKDAMDHVQAGVPEINTLQLLPPRTSKSSSIKQCMASFARMCTILLAMLLTSCPLM